MADWLQTGEDVAVAKMKQLVVDCRHPATLARFWAAALDDFEIRAYDERESRTSQRSVAPPRRIPV